MMTGKPETYFEPDEELVARYARTGTLGCTKRLSAVTWVPARSMAVRYAGRGEPTEDLIQVANLGLVAALQRFDPDAGTPFLAFAARLLGELRRHFRDRVLPLRLPRALQERVAELEKVIEILTAHSDIPRPSKRSLSSCHLTTPMSWRRSRHRAGEESILDASLREDADGYSETIGSMQGEIDKGFELVEDWHAVRSVLGRLSEDEQAVIRLDSGLR